jgi:hypothetical protein
MARTFQYINGIFQASMPRRMVFRQIRCRKTRKLTDIFFQQCIAVSRNRRLHLLTLEEPFVVGTFRLYSRIVVRRRRRQTTSAARRYGLYARPTAPSAAYGSRVRALTGRMAGERAVARQRTAVLRNRAYLPSVYPLCTLKYMARLRLGGGPTDRLIGCASKRRRRRRRRRHTAVGHINRWSGGGRSVGARLYVRSFVRVACAVQVRSYR